MGYTPIFEVGQRVKVIHGEMCHSDAGATWLRGIWLWKLSLRSNVRQLVARLRNMSPTIFS